MHYKICLETENEFVPDLKVTSKSDIERYNTDIDFFKDFWKPIHKYNCVNKYKVAYENDTYEKVKSIWKEWNQEIEVIKCSKDNKSELIIELSNRAENKNLHLFIKEEMDYQSFNFYYPSNIIGFYSKLVGYQRKGIKDEFFNIFNHEKTGYCNFVKQKDFENVYYLIGRYYDNDCEDDVLKLKEIYKRDFLDKYEYGKSILSISY